MARERTNLDRVHVGELAGRALEAEHDLLGGLSLNDFKVARQMDIFSQRTEEL